MRKITKARPASILAILSTVLLAVQPAFAGSCDSTSNTRAKSGSSNFEMRVNSKISSGTDGWWVIKKSFLKNIDGQDYSVDKSDKIIPLSSSARNVYARDVRNSNKKTTSKFRITFANDPVTSRATATVTCNFPVETWWDGSGTIGKQKAHALRLDCAGNENVTTCERVYKAGAKDRFEWTIALKPSTTE